jgi:hypothetical protein
VNLRKYPRFIAASGNELWGRWRSLSSSEQTMEVAAVPKRKAAEGSVNEGGTGLGLGRCWCGRKGGAEGKAGEAAHSPLPWKALLLFNCEKRLGNKQLRGLSFAFELIFYGSCSISSSKQGIVSCSLPK